MERATFSLQAANECINEEGYLCLSDPSVGKHVSEMEKNGFEFWTEDGLDFCKQFVLFDTRIRPILQAYFGERCVLVHWLRYKAYPGHVICFRAGGLKAGRRRFIVHLLSKGSEVKYYNRSHLHELPTEDTEYRFYEVPQSSLEETDLKGENVRFDDGGFVTLDARTCLEIKKGYAIAFLFATEDVLPKWPPMYLPNLPTLREKVSEMQSAEIGVNFAFGNPQGPKQRVDGRASASRHENNSSSIQ